MFLFLVFDCVTYSFTYYMYVNIGLCYSFNNYIVDLWLIPGPLQTDRKVQISIKTFCFNLVLFEFFCPAGSDEDESNKLTCRQTMERKGFVPLQSHTNTKYFVHTTKRCVIFFVLFSYCGSLFHTRWRGILL